MKEFKFGVTTDTIIFYIDSRKNNNVRGRYRERLRKDIETMHRLEYEELVSSYMEDVEQLIIKDLG